jgi:tetratricopeptide (TPR) repeat protein
MSVIKCKMCGGDLELIEGSSVAVCEYCGSQQTVPAADNEKKLTLFARANRLRLACEFDKAAGVYESIVADFPTEAEAYWGLVLCRYGIEYVDDPATGKKIPTCHRSSFDSVMEDSDFEQALENADAVARRVYRDEAKAIEELRRGIVEVSGKEPPYDIFICYKETAEDGQRTVDSVIAQDVYDALTEKGYRVFFSRISLEDKLGTEYEPYIFAALHSAKIMLAFGTDYEYYNAVWVKNEWSRYLQLMTKDKSKHLIPCYKGIDAYDMPKEFAKLQAQDMGKVGAMQDLLRGVDKIMSGNSSAAAQPPQAATNATAESLLKRAQMFLEDKDSKLATEYAQKVLDIDPECADAYMVLLLATWGIGTWEEAGSNIIKVVQSREYKRARQFASGALADKLADAERLANEHAERLAQVEKQRIEEANRRREEEARRREYLLKKLSVYHHCHASSAIAASDEHTVGLKFDGTVVACGKNDDGQCDVSEWTDIVAAATSYEHTVGLKSDGTVVACGYNHYGQCDVSHWTDIVTVSTSYEHTVGLKSDSTVLACGKNDDSQCNVSGWTDIVAVAAGRIHTVGLKSDGTVVACGKNDDGQCDVSDWKLFDNFDDVVNRAVAEEEKRKAAAEKQRLERIAALEAEKQRSETELPYIKGLFSGGKRRDMENRLAEIEIELKKLAK